MIPTSVIYNTKIDKQVYVINNYQYVRHLSITLIDNYLKVKFNPKNCLCEFTDGVFVDVIYNNRKLFDLIKNNKFSHLEIDNLKEFHHRLHTCKIPVYNINHTKLEKYKEFSYD